MNPLCLLLAWTLPLGALAGSIQEAGRELGTKRTELVLGYFSPTKATTQDLLGAGTQLFGPQVTVTLSDGGSFYVSRFMRVGDTLVVQDDRAGVDRVLKALAEMDAKVGESGPSMGAFELSPRHVDPTSILIGLSQIRGLEVSVVQERKLLVVRGSRDALEEARRVAERIDRPAHQVTLTCQLIRGLETDASSPGLAVELTTNLRRLMPIKGFELLSVSAVRASVTDGTIDLHSETDNGITYDLQLTPSAFDAETGSLTLSRCTFSLQTRDLQTGLVSHQNFATSLALEAGEFTVLGAIGDGPVFAVLRVVPDAQPH